MDFSVFDTVQTEDEVSFVNESHQFQKLIVVVMFWLQQVLISVSLPRFEVVMIRAVLNAWK